ncbi:MAG: hypothetical protein M3Y71_11690 [Actinomycetota bacterium]|nr:hypothetical protein [Actinomycetota bacterium]
MTITGLPLHPLVVHAVVVLLPLMALVTVLVAVRPTLRGRRIWWVVGANAVMTGVTLLAKESGESLQRSLGGRIAQEHGQMGEIMPVFAGVLFLASVAVALTRRSRTLGTAATVVSVLAAAAAVVWTVRTGDSGARAVWQR